MLRAARWPRPVPALGASVLLALASLPSSRADSLPARATHVADYDMRVRLDPEAKTLDGEQRIVCAAAHWGVRWVFWLQQMLAMVGL